ncbi:MAG: hypothetical protein QG617_1409, partial [Campylobacterota bacterium]|nr:hypothetical protein [Campylobacterota bacterium]
YLKFVISPLSFMFYIAGKQKYDLAGQFILLLILVLSIAIGLQFNDEKIVLISFSIGYTIIYFAYLIYSYFLSKGEKE